MRCYLIFCAVYLLIATDLYANDSANLFNSAISASIVVDSSKSDFGALAAIFTADNKISISNLSFFVLKCGAEFATEKQVVFSNNDSLVIKLGGFGPYPLSALITYLLMDSILKISLKCWVSSTTRFDNGLSLVCIDSGLLFNNLKTGVAGFKPVHYHLDTNRTVKSCLSHYIDFYYLKPGTSDTSRQIVFSLINPFHSFWQFNYGGPGNHMLDILPIVPPNSVITDPVRRGPMAATTLLPYDTVFRDLTISLFNSYGPPVAFSEHANGFAPAVTMYWDELPNYDDWHYMTTEDDDNVKYDHFLIRLLNKHPDLKMGYLLLLDRILYRHKTAFENWDMNSPYIIADSLDEYEGAFCANIRSNDTSMAIFQDVGCNPNDTFTLSYQMKTEGIVGSGAFGVVYNKVSDRLIASGVPKTGDSGWERYLVTFTTGLEDRFLRISLEVQNSIGNAFFDNVRLVCRNDTSNLIKNPGFENNKPFFLFDNKRRHWVDAIGSESILNSATESYRTFLRRIDGPKVLFGWENRVNLGTHGYHHTPSIFEPDQPIPGWEFQYYDTIGDQLRFQKIFSGTEKIGLSRKSLKYMRPPGLMHTSSLVNILTDSGFVYLGVENKLYFHCLPIQRGKNRLWINSNIYWADYVEQNSTEPLFSVLESGHAGDIGGHPGAMFLNASFVTFDKLDRLFAEIEQKFPNMEYVFPDEYGDNANATYGLHNCLHVDENSTSHLYFSGVIRDGVSVVLQGTCSGATLDNHALAIKQVGNLSYIVLPASPDIPHDLTMYNVDYQKLAQTAKPEHIVNNKIRVFRDGYTIYVSSKSVIRTEIIDLRGKKMFTKKIQLERNSQSTFTINDLNFAAGIYILKISINEKPLAAEKILLHHF